MRPTDSADRERLLALLRDQHSYPGVHRVQVIVHNDEARIDGVLIALSELVPSDGPAIQHERHASRNGSYVSLRVSVPVGDAEEVLEIYRRLGELEGLLSYF